MEVQQTTPVYPSETNRIELTVTTVKIEKFQDSRYNEVLVIVGMDKREKIYRFDFRHQESQQMFGQMAALLTGILKEGKPKGVQVTLSGIPTMVQESEDYTVLKYCKFVAWHIK